MSENILDRVRQVTKAAAANALNVVPSPGRPDAKPGEDCGCARRKRQLQENLRRDKSLTTIISDLISDLRNKPRN